MVTSWSIITKQKKWERERKRKDVNDGQWQATQAEEALRSSCWDKVYAGICIINFTA